LKWPTVTQKNTVNRKSPFLRNSNVTQPYFWIKKQTHSLLVEEKETTKSNYWKLPLLASIAKSICCPKQNKKQKTNSWMKTWPKDISYHLTCPTDSQLSWSLKKDSKEKRYIINYCPLNTVTRKDVTPLPNLAQLLRSKGP